MMTVRTADEWSARGSAQAFIRKKGDAAMPKGMFTQGVCVLLHKPVSLDDIESVLAGFDVRRRQEASEAWAFGGPSVIVAYRPDANGFVAVDVVDQCWPDHMGDPKTDTMTFGAWTMGHFGPFAYPGGLQRAAEQCWSWEAGESIPERHKAFVRIRVSYAFGAKDDDPVMPDDYEPLPELEFVTKMASSLLDLPGSLCYFNPNGEVLRGQDGLRESLNFAWSNELPPLDAWSNVRLFNVNPEWSLMDSVGNGQLDIPDTEAFFHTESFDFGEVDNFIRNVSLYVLKKGEIVNDGDTMDGPGGIRWQSHQFEDSVCDPPRSVLRWLPMDGRPVPPEIETP
jgi:hypothetical protein